MLLFHKRDLLVTLTLVDDTVTFSKPVKEILKYQHRYNYKFKMYETGKVTVADDYIIEGETLTVFFGSAYVEYSSSGATYNEGGSGGSGGEGGGGTGGNVYNIEPIPEAEFAEGGAFYNLTINDALVVSGYYIDTDSDVNVGDVVEVEFEDFALDVISKIIIAQKNTYVDIPDVGPVTEVQLYQSDTYADNINTDEGNVSYNGKYFKLDIGGIS